MPRTFQVRFVLLVVAAAIAITLVAGNDHGSAADHHEMLLDLETPIKASMAPVSHISHNSETDIAAINLKCAIGLPGAEDLDVQSVLARLDDWTERVRSETARHWPRFQSNPEAFEGSEPYFRMLVMVTVLQQDLGVHYNPERILAPDFRDSRDLFLHGLLLANRTGTCVSLPVLYVAIGRRLGYPLGLAQAKMHLYVRWDCDNGRHINIEATSRGILCHSDEYYARWPEALSSSERASGAYLRSLTPAEEHATFLAARGHCLEDNGRLGEAAEAYGQAMAKAPQLPNMSAFLFALKEKQRVQFDNAVVRSTIFGRRPKPAAGAIGSIEWVNDINARNARLSNVHKNPSTSNHPWR